MADIITQRALLPVIEDAVLLGLDNVLVRSPGLCIALHVGAVVLLAPFYLLIVAMPGALDAYAQEMRRLGSLEDF